MILAYVYGLMVFSMLSTLYIHGYGLNGVGSNHVLTSMCKKYCLDKYYPKIQPRTYLGDGGEHFSSITWVLSLSCFWNSAIKFSMSSCTKIIMNYFL